MLHYFDCLLDIFFFFFFSSRRRHTRYWRDWSSDVCSSDLTRRALPNEASSRWRSTIRATDSAGVARTIFVCWSPIRRRTLPRSEERRVGEECRSRGSPYYLKKKKKELASG